MRLFGESFVLALILVVCVMISSSGASEQAAGYPPTVGPKEAVVTKVEQDRIVLISESEGNKELVVFRKDDGALQTGDRVMVEGNTVRKMDEASGRDATQGDGTAKTGEGQAAPEASTPAPAGGGTPSGAPQ